MVSTLRERGSRSGRDYFDRVDSIEAVAKEKATARPTRAPTGKPSPGPTGTPTFEPSLEPSSSPSGEFFLWFAPGSLLDPFLCTCFRLSTVLAPYDAHPLIF